MPKIALLYCGLILFVFVLLINDFAACVTAPLINNEQMYLTAGALVADGHAVYRDFAYFQTPYLAWFYGGLFKILPVFGIRSHYLLIGRLCSFSFFCASAAILFILAWRRLRDGACAACILALFLLNRTIVDVAAEASNYILPLMLCLLAYYFYTQPAVEALPKFMRLMVTGILLGAATGVKLTSAPLILPFLAGMALKDENRLSSMLLFMLGGVLGLLPVLYCFCYDPAVFLFNNVGYHLVNAEWRRLTGFDGPMALPDRLVYAAKMFRRPDNFLLAAGVLFFTAMSARATLCRRKSARISKEINPATTQKEKSLPVATRLILALVLFVVGLAAAVAPTPSFSQYYSLPTGCLFLLLLELGAWAAKNTGRRRPVLGVLVAATLAHHIWFWPEAFKALYKPARWPVFEVTRAATELRQIFTKRNDARTGKIATLAPLFAVEVGLPIYPEFATGPFLYRVGDLLSPVWRCRVKGTSPETVGAFLAQDPPAAVLTFYRDELEEKLVEFAQSMGYKHNYLESCAAKIYTLP